MEKVEVEEKNSVNSPNTITEETPPVAYQTSDNQIQESLRIMNEETLQLSEVVWQEEKLIKELCVLLKRVLKQLNMSFNLPLDVFPQTTKIQRIILNAEAHLIFINDKNEVQSKALEDYPPQVIFKIVSFIIPELSKLLTSYRKKVSDRLSFFDRINQELRNLSNIFVNRPKKAEGKVNAVDNGVKKALSAQQNGQDER